MPRAWEIWGLLPAVAGWGLKLEMGLAVRDVELEDAAGRAEGIVACPVRQSSSPFCAQFVTVYFGVGIPRSAQRECLGKSCSIKSLPAAEATIIVLSREENCSIPPMWS